MSILTRTNLTTVLPIFVLLLQLSIPPITTAMILPTTSSIPSFYLPSSTTTPPSLVVQPKHHRRSIVAVRSPCRRSGTTTTITRPPYYSVVVAAATSSVTHDDTQPRSPPSKQHKDVAPTKNHHNNSNNNNDNNDNNNDNNNTNNKYKDDIPISITTPHAGRHFLPSHPSFRPKPTTLRSKIQQTLRSYLPFRRSSLRPLHKRFFEGWYYRLTLPPNNNNDDDTGASFAFIVSIEDPGRQPVSKGGNGRNLAAIQIMGPEDGGYLVQSDRDDTKFWAWEDVTALGCTFRWKEEEEEKENGGGTNNTTLTDGALEMMKMTTVMDTEEWKERVVSGFQMLPTRLLGRVIGHDGSLGGVHKEQGIPGSCDFDITIRPRSGWGDDETTRLLPNDDKQRRGKKQQRTRNKRQRSGSNQKSTAGWLASYAVFEPHWQVTMADGRAEGRVTWKGRTYEFEDAPFYAEKNWGGAFPSKWYWVQCNSFEGYNRLSVTAGGGTRKIPLGRTEDLGMVSVHYNGTFYEAVPWTGEMHWRVRWGSWAFIGRCTSGDRLFETELTAECDPETVPGTVLRIPKEEGLEYFCRDTFKAEVTLSLYELVLRDKYDDVANDCGGVGDGGGTTGCWGVDDRYVRKEVPIIDRAISRQCGVEIGGGPWWDEWVGESKMKQPLKGLVGLPYVARRWTTR